MFLIHHGMPCAMFIVSHTMQINLIKTCDRLVNVSLAFDCFIGVYVWKVFVNDETLKFLMKKFSSCSCAFLC